MDSLDCYQSVKLGSDDIVPVNSAAITVTCICDQNLQATFFCEHHDDVKCKICKALKHKTCKVVTVADKSNEYDKGKLRSLLERVKELKLRNDRYMFEQNSGLQDIAVTKEKGINKIQEFRTELNSMLDR